MATTRAGDDMDCNNFRDLFSEYYDRQTSGKISYDEMTAHLAKCESCAAAYAEYAALFDDVRSLPEPELPEGFHDMLMEYVQENKGRPEFIVTRPSKRKKYIITRMSPLMAVAASLIFAVVWFAGVFQPAPEPNGYIPIAPLDGTIGIAPVDGELPFPGGRMTPPDNGVGIVPLDIEIEYPLEEEPRTRSNLLLATAICAILAGTFCGVLVILGRARRQLR